MSLETISATEKRSAPVRAFVRLLRALGGISALKTALMPERQGTSRTPAPPISSSALNTHLRRDVGLSATRDDSVWRQIR